MSESVAQPVTLTLRYLRRKRGLTQEDLAALLDVDRVTILRWESGQTRPDFNFIKPLARALRVPEVLVLDALENPAA